MVRRRNIIAWLRSMLSMGGGRGGAAKDSQGLTSKVLEHTTTRILDGALQTCESGQVLVFLVECPRNPVRPRSNSDSEPLDVDAHLLVRCSLPGINHADRATRRRAQRFVLVKTPALPAQTHTHQSSGSSAQPPLDAAGTAASSTGTSTSTSTSASASSQRLCLLLAHGSAKDRKTLLKTFKDTFQLMSGDQYGHIVILAAYDLIDDTKLTAKSILPEILGKSEEKEAQNIAFVANDLNARTTILYLFEGTSKALFPASHTADLEILAEIHEIRKTTSKKDDETRRKELVAAASPQLLAAIESSPKDLVATSFGCQMITDVLLSAVGDKSKALEAIAATAAGNPDQEAPEDPLVPYQPHISQTPFGGKMLKTLIAGGRFDRATGKVIPVDPPAELRQRVVSAHGGVHRGLGNGAGVIPNSGAARGRESGAIAETEEAVDEEQRCSGEGGKAGDC